MKKARLQRYPKTPHLPGSGAVTKDDLVVDRADQWEFAGCRSILIEEKIDGANVRIKWDGRGDLLLGNREHMLLKGYVKRETPAKLQFRPLWNWIYDRKKHFQKLSEITEGLAFTLYAEWMYAEHSIHYNKMPELLIPFAIKYDDSAEFLDPRMARGFIESAGLTPPPLLHSIYQEDFAAEEMVKTTVLDCMKPAPSAWSDSNREGIYIKVGDGVNMLARYKFVDPAFSPVTDFTERGLRKNVLV